MEEVADDLLVLILHLHVEDLGDNNCMVETHSILSQTLDHIVEVSSGSLPIGWQVAHFHLHLLSEDILLNVVVFGGHAAHRPLLPKLSRLLATHTSLHL